MPVAKPEAKVGANGAKNSSARAPGSSAFSLNRFQLSAYECQFSKSRSRTTIEMSNVTPPFRFCRSPRRAGCFLSHVFCSAQDVKFDSDSISGLGARNIGSATMSGRIAALDAVKENGRLTVYVGAASGGVWKSVNGGTTFKPVFDKQTAQSIGAIAIDPKTPKTIWAGTGESWTRNSVSVGDGIYKSTDGGENWTNMGLQRFRAHLQDPDRPQRRQHRIRLRARKTVERQRRSRAIQDDRWRQDLEQDSERRESLHRLLDDFHEFRKSQGIVRGNVGFPPQGLDLPLRRRKLHRARAAAACSFLPTAAPPGTTSTKRAHKVCPPSLGDASPSPSLLRSPASSTR